jgi:hypothetical protein
MTHQLQTFSDVRKRELFVDVKLSNLFRKFDQLLKLSHTQMVIKVA